MGLLFTKSDDVSYERENGVLRVRIDRPEKRNPLSLGVLDQLREIFTRYASGEDSRLAVVTGAGDKAFASGGDLVELAQYRSAAEARDFSEHGKAALNAIRAFPVPVVAGINGVALGGGAELALACDVRFAAPHAKIGFIHSRLAISPSWGGGVDLMRLLGYGKAVQLLARGEILPVLEARTLGLIDDVASPGSAFGTALDAFIEPMASQPPQVMRAIKALSSSRRSADLIQLQKVETDHFAITWSHQDHWAAVDALSNPAVKGS